MTNNRPLSTGLRDILRPWSEDAKDLGWVLGTVFQTEGASYRKAGAMMLINTRGERFGMLSGGCLEAEIGKESQRCLHSGRAKTVVFDATDEDDLASRMRIGCGGIVHILLQPLSSENDLGLGALIEALNNRRSGTFFQKIPGPDGAVEAFFETDTNPSDKAIKADLISGSGDGVWLRTLIAPEPHLLIVGGGGDAEPLARMAKLLGWWVTICDPRPANGRPEQFPEVDQLLSSFDENLIDYALAQKVDAAVLMSHNLTLDAKALQLAQHMPLKYLGLLGPRHRRAEVIEEAGLTEQGLVHAMKGPAGLNLGGEGPEAIALSILAEIQSALHGNLEPRLENATTKTESEATQWVTASLD